MGSDQTCRGSGPAHHRGSEEAPQPKAWCPAPPAAARTSRGVLPGRAGLFTGHMAGKRGPLRLGDGKGSADSLSP